MESSQKHQRQQRRQKTLVREAAAHGPYLWSGTDIENALLWFPPPPLPAPFGPSEEEEAEGGEGCEFLRLLLHARGIWNPRWMNQQLTLPRRKKRRKEVNTDDCEVKDRPQKPLNNKIESPSALQFVLMGYYQLFQRTEPQYDIDDEEIYSSKTSNDSNKNKMTMSTLTASTRLYSDLITIISSRQYTQELYRAAYSSLCNDNKVVAKKNCSSTQLHKMMARQIDEYMVHPTTCSRRVYAASIYDRLWNGGVEEEEEDTNIHIISKAVHKKLFGLAENNPKIREVILLLLLEPIRRLQLRQQQLQQQQKQVQCFQSPQNDLDEDHQNDLSSTQQQQQEQQQQLVEFFPLLTSQIVIMDSLNVPGVGENDNDENNYSSSSLITLLVKSILDTKNSIDEDDEWKWWSQPSPLLCIVSQFHFPIAVRYIHYWVEKAIVTHENLYRESITKSTATVLEETTFHHAIERIQHFHQTSYRLRKLLSHILHNVEDEIMTSSRGGLIDEDEESEIFRRILAWKAIKRILDE